MAQRSTLFSTLFVVVAFVVSVALRFWLDDALPAGFPYLTFFPAVILTAFFAGVRAGIVLAVICGLVAWFSFIPPVGSFSLDGLSALALALYIFIVSTEIFLIHIMKSTLVDLREATARSAAMAASQALMFHELQHRVSNNLAVVSSLLKLQRRDVSDPAARAALDAAAARLGTVARIQRALHDPDRQEVDVQPFLASVGPELIAAAGLEGRVSFDVTGDAITANRDQIVPLGLICVEAMSNALEHGLAADGHLALRIHTRKGGNDTAMVEISDDGPGLPAGFDLNTAASLGLRIARQFAAQIGAEMHMTSGTGTVVSVSYPVTAASAPVV